MGARSRNNRLVETIKNRVVRRRRPGHFSLDISVSTVTGGFISEVLSKEHDRKAFDCGHSELNAYLRTRARQEMDRSSAIVWMKETLRAIAGESAPGSALLLE